MITIVLGLYILFTWPHGNILGSGKKKVLSATIIYIQTNKQKAIIQEDGNARN